MQIGFFVWDVLRSCIAKLKAYILMMMIISNLRCDAVDGVGLICANLMLNINVIQLD